MDNSNPDLHFLEVYPERCSGCFSCMRVCPTKAIRVRNGKVDIDHGECIFCGHCIVACDQEVIHPLTDKWESINRFPFKVAIPSTSLFGQFAQSVSVQDIYDGLLAIGFDDVYDLSIETELANHAIQEYLDDYAGPLPLISSTCPVVVRLIQYFYPDMASQLIPIESPRELAAREVKKLFSKKHGIPIEDVGAIYITPCSAKTAAIKKPAEGVVSHLDLAISIADIYNPLLQAITHLQSKRDPAENMDWQSPIKSRLALSMTLTGGLSNSIRQNRYITISQLPNITRVIEDIEKGKIRDVEFLECYSCTGGCIGGPLNVDNLFVARSKIEKLIREIDDPNKYVDEEVKRRYHKGDYFLRNPLKPRPVSTQHLSIREQIEHVKIKEALQSTLPGTDCGLCGSPTCAVFAEDVSNSRSRITDCIFFSKERIDDLKRVFDFDESLLPKIESGDD